LVDSDTGDEICLCGKLKGEREKKYRNRITVYRDQTYGSAFEAEYTVELSLKKRGGLIKDWERQVNIRTTRSISRCTTTTGAWSTSNAKGRRRGTGA
jgi:hypothetical protein